MFAYFQNLSIAALAQWDNILEIRPLGGNYSYGIWSSYAVPNTLFTMSTQPQNQGENCPEIGHNGSLC